MPKFMRKLTTRDLAYLGLLLAADIVLTRFLSIQTPVVRIGFSFLAVAICGMLYGPLWAGATAALADLLGANLFPAGAYFPGFTLTALLTGAVYGLFLYRNNSWARIIAAVLLISVGLNLCLDTLWLSILLEKGYIGLLPGRIVKCILMAPVQVALIRMVSVKLRLVPPRAAKVATGGM